VTLLWRTSTYSAQGNCVEVALIPGACLVRDSKLAEGPVLAVSAEGWAAVLADLRDGRLR
jgi:hypothetical protein